MKAKLIKEFLDPGFYSNSSEEIDEDDPELQVYYDQVLGELENLVSDDRELSAIIEDAENNWIISSRFYCLEVDPEIAALEILNRWRGPVYKDTRETDL